MTQSTAESLIGTKVNITAKEDNFGTEENPIIYKFYSLTDPDFIKKVNSINATNRIRLPGTMVTADYKPTRLNVHISEDGIVSDVSYG